MKIGSLDLHVVDEGAGRPPLLLVHGFTGSDIDWVDVQPALAARRRVVSYTHRGHGDSVHTTSYSLDELVGDLESVVEQLQLAPMHLLGHSMGGVVALRYALAHPDPLASLILMDTFAAPPSDGSMGAMIDGMVDTAMRDGVGAVLDGMRPFLAAAPPEIAARVEYKVLHMDPAAFVTLGRSLASFPSMADRLGELAHLPVTVIVGANDTPLLDSARFLHDAIPGSRLEVVPDAGHSPQEDNPDAWLRAVEDHLASPGSLSYTRS